MQNALMIIQVIFIIRSFKLRLYWYFIYDFVFRCTKYGYFIHVQQHAAEDNPEASALPE